MVLDAVGPIGFLTRSGHNAIYLSNVCPDRSPVTLRLCHPGERGGVVSKYTPISENEDYDWAIVPFEQFLNGFESPELAPLFGVPKLQSAIQDYNFGPLFSSVLTGAQDGHFPDGEWRTTVATRFDRTIYNLSIATTVDEDKTIVDAFNSAENKSRFNFFYRNCSNQAKEILNLILREQDAIGDRVGGLTMEVPKGLAKTLIERALEHPELQLRVERYTQLPGTFHRSHDVLFPMENTYKNISFAPYWYFGGFSEFAIGAMFYHQLVSPFSLIGSMRDFVSPRAAQLTFEQRRLRTLQDQVRVKLISARATDDQRLLELEQLNARVFRGLRDVKDDKNAEVQRVFGSREQWRDFELEFRSTARDIGRQATFPDDITRCLLQCDGNGELSRLLLKYFEADGEFYIDPSAGGPWMRLRLSGPEWQSTGLSLSQVLAGSPRLAFLVLATVIDHNLSRAEGRREHLDYMERIFGLLRQTKASLIAPPARRLSDAS